MKNKQKQSIGTQIQNEKQQLKKTFPLHGIG